MSPCRRGLCTHHSKEEEKSFVMQERVQVWLWVGVGQFEESETETVLV